MKFALAFLSTLIITQTSFASPFISARIGYLESVLPSLILLKNEMEGLRYSYEGHEEAARSLKNWTTNAEIHLRRIKKNPEMRWSYLQFESLFESLDRILLGKQAGRENTGKNLQVAIEILQESIDEMKAEAANPEKVDRTSEAYYHGRSEGLEMTFAFFQSDASADASEITRLRSQKLSLFLKSIDLSQIKLQGMQIALTPAELQEINELFIHYIQDLEKIKSDFPTPRFFANEDYRQKLRTAAMKLRDLRIQYAKKMNMAFEIRRKTLARGWKSPVGSCYHTFRIQ